MTNELASKLRKLALAKPTRNAIEQSIASVDWIFKLGWYDSFELTEVPVDNLTPGDDTHSGKDPSIVTDLAKQYKTDPESVPPPVLKHDGNTILDGHHRWLGAKEAGLSEIWAIVLQ